MSSAKTQLAVKRLFDITVSFVAIIVLAPLFIGLALFVRLRSPGPVIFRQNRVGRDGKSFALLKFRSMHSRNLVSPNSVTTHRGDPRIFPGGTTLRKYKLDELPQFFNVLRGDMSIVGPRPTVREDYDRMDSEQRRRASVRPGLTGLAQISGNTSLSWPERIQFDLQYIDNLSFLEDLKIISKTMGQIVSGRADTHPKSDDEWR